MRYSIVIPALFAASSFAAPAVKYVTDVKIVQVTVTEGTPQATAAAAANNANAYPVAAPPAAPPAHHKNPHHKKPHHHHHAAPPPAAVAPVVTYAPAPAPTQAAPQPPAPVVSYIPAPPPSYKPAPPPVAKPSPAPKPAPKPSPSSTPSSGGDDSILGTFNKWRKAYNLPEATWDQSLADNAYLTGKGGNGVEQKHILPTLTHAGSCAQVITPGANEAIEGYGDHSPFEIAMLSWLCEKSTDSQISALCPSVVKANGMRFVDTAHHDDLVNPEYTKVGCAFFPNPSPDVGTPWRGLWTCSLES